MDKTQEELKKVFESKSLYRILCAIGIAIVAMLIFSAGIVVGFHKASFGRDWGNNYNENFGMGHRNMQMGGMEKTGMMDYYPNSHGAIGKIIKIELPNIFVQGKDNTEKVVLINTDTKMQKERADIKTEDLHVDDYVVVIGTPDSKGVIEAKLIRVIPSPEFLTQPEQ